MIPKTRCSVSAALAIFGESVNGHVSFCFRLSAGATRDDAAVERRRGVALQGVARRLLQKLLRDRPYHRNQDLQTGKHVVRCGWRTRSDSFAWSHTSALFSGRKGHLPFKPWFYQPMSIHSSSWRSPGVRRIRLVRRRLRRMSVWGVRLSHFEKQKLVPGVPVRSEGCCSFLG